MPTKAVETKSRSTKVVGIKEVETKSRCTKVVGIKEVGIRVVSTARSGCMTSCPSLHHAQERPQPVKELLDQHAVLAMLDRPARLARPLVWRSALTSNAVLVTARGSVRCIRPIMRVQRDRSLRA